MFCESVKCDDLLALLHDGVSGRDNSQWKMRYSNIPAQIYKSAYIIPRSPDGFDPVFYHTQISIQYLTLCG